MRNNFKTRGFTLIELLAAVSILVVIVTIVGMIFAESDKAWTTGTQRVDKNMSGRAALNLIAHDLQYVVVDDIITMNVGLDRDTYEPPADSSVSYGFANSELTFASINNDPTDAGSPERAVREVFYYVRQYRSSVAADDTDYTHFKLMRGYYADQILAAADSHCYKNAEWCTDPDDPIYGDGLDRPGSDVVCENVAGFAVYAADPWISVFEEGTSLMRNFYSADYSNMPPPYVDICLELLNDRPARQIADLIDSGMSYTNVLEKNVTRFTTRVYLQNWDRRWSPETP